MADDTFFHEAEKEVKPGRFRLYQESLPDYLCDHVVDRAAGAHNCKMVVATLWGKGKIGGVTPKGTTYLVFTYCDDKHGTKGPQHFNKDVQFFFRDQKGDPFQITVKGSRVVDHYVDAVATGTSFPHLKKAYRLPSIDSGSITDLAKLNVSMAPYPKDREDESSKDE